MFFWKIVNEYGITNTARANNYIKRFSMERFIRERWWVEHCIGRQYGFLSLKLFFIYCIISFSVYKYCDNEVSTYSIEQLNYSIYKLFVFFHVPIYSPTGWNLNYLLSLFFCLFIFLGAIINQNTLWVVKVIKLPWYKWVKIICYKLMIFVFCFLVILPVFYVIPDFKGGRCELPFYDMCFLKTDNMYLYTLFQEYLLGTIFFHFVYIATFTLNLRLVIR